MSFTYQRRYRGPLRAAILDWAGTTMDHGCMAPAVVFRDVFARQGVPISMEEARAPMGAHKRVHIQQIAAQAPVRERWVARHQRPPEEADIDRMFADFIELQLACLSTYSQLIPGALEAVAAMRQRGLKIGSTSGYTRPMMEVLLRDAARQGYSPDATVCATDVPAGRPLPFMCLRNVIELEVWPIEACVKIDDTLPGVEEGLNAGMWTIGLAMTGNEIGLSLRDLEALTAAERTRRGELARERFLRTGAHFVVDGLRDVAPCLDEIQQRLARGERP